MQQQIGQRGMPCRALYWGKRSHLPAVRGCRRARQTGRCAHTALSLAEGFAQTALLLTNQPSTVSCCSSTISASFSPAWSNSPRSHNFKRGLYLVEGLPCICVLIRWCSCLYPAHVRSLCTLKNSAPMTACQGCLCIPALSFMCFRAWQAMLAP